MSNGRCLKAYWLRNKLISAIRLKSTCCTAVYVSMFTCFKPDTQRKCHPLAWHGFEGWVRVVWESCIDVKTTPKNGRGMHAHKSRNEGKRTKARKRLQEGKKRDPPWKMQREWNFHRFSTFHSEFLPVNEQYDLRDCRWAFSCRLGASSAE